MKEGIVVYGRKSNCPNCVIAKKYIELRNDAYTFIDIDDDADARQEMIDKGLRALPVIFKDGELIGSGARAVDMLYSK